MAINVKWSFKTSVFQSRLYWTFQVKNLAEERCKSRRKLDQYCFNVAVYKELPSVDLYRATILAEENLVQYQKLENWPYLVAYVGSASGTRKVNSANQVIHCLASVVWVKLGPLKHVCRFACPEWCCVVAMANLYLLMIPDALQLTAHSYTTNYNVSGFFFSAGFLSFWRLQLGLVVTVYKFYLCPGTPQGDAVKITENLPHRRMVSLFWTIHLEYNPWKQLLARILKGQDSY